MRKSRRKNGNKKLILSSIVFVALFMAAGYAVLSTDIFIAAEVNVLTAEKYLWYNLQNKVTSSDSNEFMSNKYESSKYSYIGENPNNYITLNNGELWRIVSVESDHTIKVVKWDNTLTKAFDEIDNRTESSSYCTTLENGCNAWTTRSLFSSGDIEGSIDNDSSIATYLNTVYYNGLDSTFQEQIVEHSFNIGPVEKDATFEMAIMQEEEYSWSGKVGLLSITEMLYPTNASSMTLGTSYENNYLLKFAGNNFLWTITPVKNNSSEVWTILNDKTQTGKNAALETEMIEEVNYEFKVLPTVYLKGTLQYISGNGSIDSPFVVK